MDILFLLFAVELILISVTLVSASYQDLGTRRINPRTWSLLLGCVPMALVNYGLIFMHGIWDGLLTMICVLFACGTYYLIARINIFGGADAIALIAITVLVPSYPFANCTLFHFAGDVLNFPLIVLINSMILGMFVPVGLWIYNTICGNKGTIIEKCTCVFGEKWMPYPVPFLIPITAGFFMAATLGI